jgi:hypothetical protein
VIAHVADDLDRRHRIRPRQARELAIVLRGDLDARKLGRQADAMPVAFAGDEPRVAVRHARPAECALLDQKRIELVVEQRFLE